MSYVLPNFAKSLLNVNYFNYFNYVNNVNYVNYAYFVNKMGLFLMQMQIRTNCDGEGGS